MNLSKLKSIILSFLAITLFIFSSAQNGHALFGYNKIKVEIDDLRNLKIARLKVSCPSVEKASILKYKLIMYFKNELKGGRILKSKIYFNIQEAPSNLRILEEIAVVKLNSKIYSLKIENRSFEPVREGRNIIGSITLNKAMMHQMKNVDVIVIKLFPGRMLTFKLKEKSITKARELFNRK